MKRIFIPTRNGSDWQPLLAKPKLHWKKGRSAMSAAACWEDAVPNLPEEILETLEGSNDPALKELELMLAIPEWEVELPGGTNNSQTDVLAITRNDNGLVVLAVEAKFEETFGEELKKKKEGATEEQLSRISYLENELGRSSPLPDNVRYQLLHRTVSALLTARAFHAPIAVMLVQSFSPRSAWREDFDTFCNELQCSKLGQNLYEVQNIRNTRLLLGWCSGNQKYLEIELPSIL